MTIEITLEVEGQKISLDELAAVGTDQLRGDITIEAVKGMGETLHQALDNTSCPIHHQWPSVTIILSASEGPKIRMRTCCQAFLDTTTVAIKKALKQRR